MKPAQRFACSLTRPMPDAQSQGRAASMQPLGTVKNKKGHHLNTPPLWETSRAQHCQAGRYSWAMKNMTIEIKVPFLGESISEATITKLYVRAGNAVRVDDLIAELETDKANIAVSAPTNGVIAELKVKEGDIVSVGYLIALMSEGVFKQQ
jgi:biotin carboxyl carrier protein